MKAHHVIDVFHTGDGTSWCFEVHDDKAGKLLGEGYNFDSAKSAETAAKKFSDWCVL